MFQVADASTDAERAQSFKFSRLFLEQVFHSSKWRIAIRAVPGGECKTLYIQHIFEAPRFEVLRKSGIPFHIHSAFTASQ
jgi:hypothetical protein